METKRTYIIFMTNLFIALISVFFFFLHFRCFFPIKHTHPRGRSSASVHISRVVNVFQHDVWEFISVFLVIMCASCHREGQNSYLNKEYYSSVIWVNALKTC